MKPTKVYFTDRPAQDVVLYKTDLVVFNRPVFVEKTKRSYGFYIENAFIVAIYKSNASKLDAAKVELSARFERCKTTEVILIKYIASCLANVN